jgi:hypothetical protein
MMLPNLVSHQTKIAEGESKRGFYMKKIIAAAITLMFICLTTTLVYASDFRPRPAAGERPERQRPVSDSAIVANDNLSGGNSYNLNIRWTRPERSLITDLRIDQDRLTEALAVAPPWMMYPSWYDVRFRNATAGETFGADFSLPTFPITPAPDSVAQDRGRPGRLTVGTGARQFPMRANSLYEIDIAPVRFIPALGALPPGSPPGAEPPIITVPAVIDDSPGLPQGKTLLFLTDVQITGDGRGNSITVTWQDPSWGGVNIFPFWEIAYDVYVTGRPVQSSGRVFPVGGVDAGHDEIRRYPDGTLSVTITDPGIRPIGRYAVRVEPLLGPNPSNVNHQVRQRDSADIRIGGRDFSVFFTGNEYRTVVSMIPELQVEQVGAAFVRLWWPFLTALRGGIHRVEIEQWPVSMEGMAPTSSDGRIGQPLRVLGGPFFLDINYHMEGPGIPRESRGFALAIHMGEDDGFGGIRPTGEVLRTRIVVHDPQRVEFEPYRPEIISLDHVGEGNISMEWFAFARFPATPNEIPLVPPGPPEGGPYAGRFVDTSLHYEIFVSDSWQDMENMVVPLLVTEPGQLLGGRRASLLDPPPDPMYWDPTWRLYPFDNISQYQALTNEGIEIRDITGNRVYFVKIRAVRQPGGQSSKWAYGSVYVPPLEQIELTPEMIAAPPVRIVADGITETSIPLEWDVRYLEIMLANPGADRYFQYDCGSCNNNPDCPNCGNMEWSPDRDTWHTIVGVTPPPARLIFGRSAAHINFMRGAGQGTDARHRFLNDILGTDLRRRLLGLDEFPMNPGNPVHVAEVLGNSRREIANFLSGEWQYSPDPNEPPMALRMQNTETFRYQIHAVPYQTVLTHPNGFEGYRSYIQLSTNRAMWQSIGEPDIDIKNGIASYLVEGLDENTAYMIFIRPYILVGGQERIAAFPSFVTGTTIVDQSRPTPDPTTPVLHPVPKYTTRNRVAVRWRVQSDMVYQLRISHFFSDYSAGGTAINISYDDIKRALEGNTVELEEPRSILDVQEINGVQYFHLRIHERFPATNYYIWATATGVDESGNTATAPSLPSNPVDILTHDIEPPPPPRNLSRAPQNLLNMYNRYNETEHRNDEPDNLIISFMRIFDDLRDDMGNLTERADSGNAEGGSADSLNMPNIDVTDAYLAIHMIRFADLNANRRFYVRARTILTVRRDEADSYSYEIEISENEEFLDSIKFTIPPLVESDPINTRRAVSEWVNIELDTGFGDDEFDGVHRPDQYPLPERDWEISYNPVTQTLTWRFRTNQRGEDGRLDQNVDQRFITRLIQDRVFTFTADLSSFGGQPVANREIILPESILRAFDERRISFEILAGDKNIVIPPGALNTAQFRALQPGTGTYYHISLNSLQSGMPPLTPNTSFATIPNRLMIQARTPRRTENLTTFARPIEIVLPVETHMSPEGLRTGLFVADTNTASWRDTMGQFNFANNTLSFGVQTPTTFAGITRNAPPALIAQNQPNQSTQALNRVSARMTITDLTNFNPSREVTANEFNNIVNALVNNRTTATIGNQLTPAEARSLTNARLFAQNITHAAALDIMVRLYENRTRQILTPMTSAASIPGIQNASAAQHRNIRIAADLGMLTGPLEPNARLTMGDLMNMADIVITDSGM